jgi:uncharacterized membrane protein
MTQTYTSQATTSQATHTSAAFAPGDFRVGHVISTSFALLFRHFLTFFIVTLIAFAPLLLLRQDPQAAAADPGRTLALLGLGFLLLMVMSMFSSAIILHGAFQDMRNRPVNLLESLRVAFRRFLPLITLALLETLLLVLGIILLIVPGIIFYTMWMVAVAACVVERTGPWRSLRRSQELTKGHRWKMFGLFLVLMLLSLIGPLLQFVLTATAGATVAAIGNAIWAAIASAFSSTMLAVTYYDLRVAKEGIDIEQIASVFD